MAFLVFLSLSVPEIFPEPIFVPLDIPQISYHRPPRVAVPLPQPQGGATLTLRHPKLEMKAEPELIDVRATLTLRHPKHRPAVFNETR